MTERQLKLDRVLHKLDSKRPSSEMIETNERVDKLEERMDTLENERVAKAEADIDQLTKTITEMRKLVADIEKDIQARTRVCTKLLEELEPVEKLMGGELPDDEEIENAAGVVVAVRKYNYTDDGKVQADIVPVPKKAEGRLPPWCFASEERTEFARPTIGANPREVEMGPDGTLRETGRTAELPCVCSRLSRDNKPSLPTAEDPRTWYWDGRSNLLLRNTPAPGVNPHNLETSAGCPRCHHYLLSAVAPAPKTKQVMSQEMIQQLHEMGVSLT